MHQTYSYGGTEQRLNEFLLCACFSQSLSRPSPSLHREEGTYKKGKIPSRGTHHNYDQWIFDEFGIIAFDLPPNIDQFHFSVVHFIKILCVLRIEGDRNNIWLGWSEAK